MSRTVLALLLALLAPAVAAQTLPVGLYDCWISNMNLGQIVMKGDKYRGPVHGADFQGASLPFTTDGPTITWGGPVGGITAAGTIVSTVVKGDADGTISGFDISLQSNQSGNFQTVTCYAPG
jgi:hypothetical protein